MKKLLGILLTFVVLFTAVSLTCATTLTASAASPTTLNFDVTSDGANEIYKHTGDIITVTFAIENATEDAPYDISSFANEIYYDHNFFEEVENSVNIAPGVNGFARFDEYSWGEHRTFFNGYQIPTAQYAAKQTIGTFKLRIIATEGSSNISNIDDRMYAMSVDSGEYTLTKTDLVVKIGDAPNPKGYEITFNANGGTGSMAAVSDISGSYILPSCSFTAPAGKQFKGWATSAIGDVITSLEVTENIALYAIWEDINHTHNFNVLQYNEDMHWNKCESCDETDIKENHKGGTADCLAKAECSVCGQPYGTENTSNHAKDSFIYQPNVDNITHTKKYECCGAVVLLMETHTYEIDNKCVCGASTLATHIHIYSSEWSKSDKGHWRECECGEKIDKSAHSYDKNDKCVCGVEKTGEEQSDNGVVKFLLLYIIILIIGVIVVCLIQRIRRRRRRQRYW